MLQLRRGIVSGVVGRRHGSAWIEVALEDGVRSAVTYEGLAGPVEVGDDVVVNTEAADRRLGSGGFDIVVVNLTRGLGGRAEEDGRNAMKLNYTPLQHCVTTLEEGSTDLTLPIPVSVGVLALHGQLAPAAFAAKRTRAALRIGYVQTWGGALPAALLDTVEELRERGLLDGHVSAGASFGAEHESATVAAALHCAARDLGWQAALVGPGPGIQGSRSALGHGGMAALDAAHAAIGLGAEVVLVPRLSGGDRRERHRGLSHHTRTVLRLLLGAVTVALPDSGEPAVEAAASDLLDETEWRAPHSIARAACDELLEEYRRSGLPSVTMGRSLDEDRAFFLAALAGGAVVASPPVS